MQKVKKKHKNKIIGFLNSPISIIIYLFILVIVLLGFNYYLANETKFYVFSGYTDEITLLDGSIYIGHDINNMTSPSIIYYGEEDILLKNYEVGYYLVIDDEYFEISSVSRDDYEDDDDLVSLSLLLNSIEFSFTEYHKNAFYFSSTNLEYIDTLTFKIDGIDDNDEEVLIEIELDVVDMLN